MSGQTYTTMNILDRSSFSMDRRATVSTDSNRESTDLVSVHPHPHIGIFTDDRLSSSQMVIFRSHVHHFKSTVRQQVLLSSPDDVWNITLQIDVIQYRAHSHTLPFSITMLRVATLICDITRWKPSDVLEPLPQLHVENDTTMMMQISKTSEVRFAVAWHNFQSFIEVSLLQ